jgi:hypothetical protein
MLADRWLSACLALAGAAMVAFGIIADRDEGSHSLLTFVGFDCLLFSLVGFLCPRSNLELRHQAINFAQFTALAVASFGAVAVLVFVLFGAPRPVGEEVFSTSLTLGLAAALVTPIFAKHFITKIRAKQ